MAGVAGFEPTNDGVRGKPRGKTLSAKQQIKPI